MRLMVGAASLLTVCLGALAACTPSDPEQLPNLGGMAGGGTGGAVGGQGGEAGGGGAGGGSGGSGCAGGAGGEAGWLYNDAGWRELPAASSEELELRIREAVPGALRFPPVSWEPCGPGCEVAVLERRPVDNWYAAIDTVHTAGGTSIWLATTFWRQTSSDGSVVRRLVDLRSGETMAALRIDELPPHPGRNAAFMQESTALLATRAMAHAAKDSLSGGPYLRILYDPHAGEWELKLPWRDDLLGGTCDSFVVDSSPPAFLWGCDAVSVIASPGSDERTIVEGSENYGSGAGNAGLGAWSEIQGGLPRVSRIRTWSPADGAKLLVESMPGVACGVAVSADRVAGLRSGDPQQATHCMGLLAEPEFWSVDRAGGEVATHSVPGVEPVYVGRGATWGDHAAVITMVESAPKLSKAQRSSIWLVRFSDGKMRRFVPSDGHSWVERLVALDDEHLYIGENPEDEGGIVTRIHRYRLDRFEEIGMPLE